MQLVRDFFILGLPIDTSLGKLHFIKVKEYPEFIQYLPYIQMEKFEFVDFLCKTVELDKDILNQMSYVQLIHETQKAVELYEMYKAFFRLCFKDDVFDKITNDDELLFYKQLIFDMNVVRYIPKNPNPEIEKFNEYKRKMASSINVSFESIVSSVMLYYHGDVNELTVYQLHALFARISQFKNYEIMSIARLFSSEVGNIPMWFEHVDLLDKEQKTLEDSMRKAKELGFIQ